MSATYVYSISTDFSAPPNIEQLHQEINNSTIIPSLIGITVLGDDLTTEFNSALSGAEQTTLDGIVAAHTPIPDQDLPMIGTYAPTTTTNINLLSPTVLEWGADIENPAIYSLSDSQHITIAEDGFYKITCKISYSTGLVGSVQTLLRVLVDDTNSPISSRSAIITNSILSTKQGSNDLVGVIEIGGGSAISVSVTGLLSSLTTNLLNSQSTLIIEKYDI